MMNKPHICIPVLLWRRHDVFRVWHAAMQLIIREFCNSVEFTIIIVGSEGHSSRQFIESLDPEYRYFEFPNDHLGEKAQFRLEKAQEINPDGVLFLGSDDIISISTFAYLFYHFQQGHDFIAPLDMYYHHQDQIHYSRGYTQESGRFGEALAPGRLLNRSILNKLNWKLWANGPETKGLDSHCFRRLFEAAEWPFFFHQRHTGTMIMDIKTGENITPFHHLSTTLFNLYPWTQWPPEVVRELKKLTK